jgi:GR25 family glycosyltransferase involved in LPS biosynthesis
MNTPSIPSDTPNAIHLTSIDDINHVMYINLDSRQDRRQHIEVTLDRLGIDPSKITRLAATQTRNGAIGCSISHIRCLLHAKEHNWPHVLIVEDDLQFTDITKFKSQCNKFLQTGIRWDVVLMAGNNVGPHGPITDCCVKISMCQTTTGYLVKQDYYDTLLSNFKTGVDMLVANPRNHIQFAIDKYWFNLQKKDDWFLIYPLYGTQATNYSNIEGRHTNYDKLMLTLDKSYRDYV